MTSFTVPFISDEPLKNHSIFDSGIENTVQLNLTTSVWLTVRCVTGTVTSGGSNKVI